MRNKSTSVHTTVSVPTSASIAHRCALFSTATICCTLLMEYILLSQGFIGSVGFVVFFIITALFIWSFFFFVVKKYQSSWYEQIAQNNKDLQLQALFSTLNPWPVLRFDRYGQLISKNSCATTFFYTVQAADNTQRSVFDFFPEITKDAWQSIVQQESHFELEHNRSGYWLCFYFRSHAQLGVINVYGFDVTEYKRQHAVKDQHLSEVTKDLQYQNKLIFDIYNALQKPARFVKQSIAAGKDMTAYSNMSHLKRLLEIVSQLEDLTELDAEQFHQQIHSFDCRSMFEKIIQNAAKQVYQLETDITFDYDLGGHDYIIADSRRLKQALEATLQFALDRSIGALVLVKMRWISNIGLTSIEALDNSVGHADAIEHMVLRVSIHDSGALNEQVLELFDIDSCLKKESKAADWKGPQSKEVASKRVGHDLRLRFMSTIVPLVGGDVSAQGSPLGGHEIRFDWPVGVSPDHEKRDPSYCLAQYHIHVFDYVQLSAESIAKALARSGASVEYSATTAIFLEKMKTYPPHILVYAAQRGHQVNHEILEKARQYCGGSLAICLMVHCNDDLSDAQFNHPGVHALVTKPFCENLLIQGVSQAAIQALQLQDNPLEVVVEASNDSEKKSVSQPQVLVIDDDIVVLHLISDVLKEVGIEVHLSESGAQGLHFLSRHDFDLIIVDVHMAHMDGFEVTQNIRTIYGDVLPIVGLTASEAPATKSRALHVGMNDYLVKPIDHTILVQKVSAWVHIPNIEESAQVQQTLHIIDEETPEINIREAIHLLGDDQDIFTRSLLRFYGRYGGEAQLINMLCEEQRVDHIIQRLHGLRGGASNIGAYNLRDTIFSLEKALRQISDVNTMHCKVQKVVKILNKVMVEVNFLLHYFMDRDFQPHAEKPFDLIEEELRNATSHIRKTVNVNKERP